MFFKLLIFVTLSHLKIDISTVVIKFFLCLQWNIIIQMTHEIIPNIHPAIITVVRAGDLISLLRKDAA